MNFAQNLLAMETWYQIIQELPVDGRKSCLSVSRAFHDVAATFVFSHIVIPLEYPNGK